VLYRNDEGKILKYIDTHSYFKNQSVFGIYFDKKNYFEMHTYTCSTHILMQEIQAHVTLKKERKHSSYCFYILGTFKNVFEEI
jgi:hypothetical protein